MKKVWLILSILFVLPICVLTADPAEEAVGGVIEEKEALEGTEAVVEVAETGPSLGQNVWAFLNSSLGVSVVVFVLSFILGKIFTAKPKWKALVLKYGPSLMSAVKEAEKRIDDDTPNRSLNRLDKALEYVIKLEPGLVKVKDEELKKALTAVHASAEANGNLAKEKIVNVLAD